MFDILKKRKKNSMYRKLFKYLIIFALMLLLYVFFAMALFGQYKDVKKNYVKNFDMQLSIMKKEIQGYFDKTAISAMDLSKISGSKLEDMLQKEKINFEDLKDRRELLAQLQDLIFEDLKNSMFNADASGAFIIWNSTVNSKVKRVGDFRNGIYIKLDSRSLKESSVIVYRGDVEVSKRHNSMPHRKWKLEFDISTISKILKMDKKMEAPLLESYNMTPVFTLPGTDQKVILISLPIIGKDGTFYGICGFEVEQMFFKEKLSQPSKLERLTSLFVPKADKNKKIDTDLVLSSGTEDGYYYLPKDSLLIKNRGSDLIEFIGKDNNYIGMKKELSLLKNGERSMLLAMVPQSDYKRDVVENVVNIAITVILFLFFSIGGSLIFTKRYISPITEGLAKIEDHENMLVEADGSLVEEFGFYEINQLIDSLRKKMKTDNFDGIPVYLAKKFKDFIEATESLTPAEMNVLNMLIQGHSVDELPEILFVSKSTAKHHILQIYKKLNVSSRGELLLYLDMIKGCGIIDNIINKKEKKD